jgi:hypothetical protein
MINFKMFSLMVLIKLLPDARPVSWLNGSVRLFLDVSGIFRCCFSGNAYGTRSKSTPQSSAMGSEKMQR